MSRDNSFRIFAKAAFRIIPPPISPLPPIILFFRIISRGCVFFLHFVRVFQLEVRTFVCFIVYISFRARIGDELYFTPLRCRFVSVRNFYTFFRQWGGFMGCFLNVFLKYWVRSFFFIRKLYVVYMYTLYIVYVYIINAI